MQFEPKAIVSDACASFSTLDTLNADLGPSVKEITQTTDFFAYYRLNLYNRVCPFWSDANGVCGNIACAVNTLDNEEDVPAIWRSEELSKLSGPKAEHPGRVQQAERRDRPLQGELGDDVGESCVVEYDDECDDRDYCLPEDESASAKGDYVSLVDNPERFTGYVGESAQQVWNAIYAENCFSRAPPSPPSSNGNRAARIRAASDLRSVIQDHNRQQVLANHPPPGTPLVSEDDECLEARVFYRIISGMHASISTHLCWDYLNQTTGLWGPNMACYAERLATHPERISNLYFNYGLVLRAVAKLRDHLTSYTFCSGDPTQDRDTKAKVLRLANAARAAPKIFDETRMFASAEAQGLKEDFRTHFRNVSRLMDCVGCDKCRLWGKLQTAGYGAALKVLFEFDESPKTSKAITPPPLRRTELVALVNTLDRISASITALGKFRHIVESRPDASLYRPLSEAERERWLYDGLPEDDEADDEMGSAAREQQPEQSIRDAVLEEWLLVWKTFRFVIRQWISIPGVV